MLMGISGLDSLVLISRGEGGVGFLVRECIAEEVEFIRYEGGGRGKEALYCICQLRVVRLQ